MIPTVAVLGLVAYILYQVYKFPGGIVAYFQDKKNLVHIAFSAITMVILLLMVDWSSIQKTFELAKITFNYSYVIAGICGWFNGSLFMALMNIWEKAAKKKTE